MKKFKKNKEGLFICEECGRTYKNQSALGNHTKIHIPKFDYFEKYLFEDAEGYCLFYSFNG